MAEFAPTVLPGSSTRLISRGTNMGSSFTEHSLEATGTEFNSKNGWVLAGLSGVLCLLGISFYYQKRKSLEQKPRDAKPNVHPMPSSPFTKAPQHLNDWVLGRTLGKGAFGIVYAGLHARTGRSVAIKVLFPQYTFVEEGDEDSLLSELQSEFELVQQIHHPNIVDMISLEVSTSHSESDLKRPLAWLVMERCDDSLLAQLRRIGPVTHEHRLAVYARQILSGLAALHAHGVLHRDIKPANVLVDNHGTLKLSDFGVSRHTSNVKTQTIHLAGSPVYLSPEAIQGRYSVYSDIWAVGITLAEMLTSAIPWSDQVVDGGVSKLLIFLTQQAGVVLSESGEITGALPLLPKELSPEAQQFFYRMLRRQPEERGSANELLQDPFLKFWSATLNKSKNL